MSKLLREGETRFVLHGLDIDARQVRATVFIQKFRQFLDALKTADRIANSRISFEYVITGLDTGNSAAATVREKQTKKERPHFSSIAVFEGAATAVYNGDRSAEKMPLELVERIQKLSAGIAKGFSHAEVAFADENVIRIDDFMQRQADVAYEVVTLPEREVTDSFYRGIATGSFDGYLKEIDARGTVLRGKLILAAGGDEIDCVMNKERVPEARKSFDKRVVIEGSAHYDGEAQLPVRIDVRAIQTVGDGNNLLRWRGAFRGPRPDEVDEDW